MKPETQRYLVASRTADSINRTTDLMVDKMKESLKMMGLSSDEQSNAMVEFIGDNFDRTRCLNECAEILEEKISQEDLGELADLYGNHPVLLKLASTQSGLLSAFSQKAEGQMAELILRFQSTEDALSQFGKGDTLPEA